MTGWRPWHDVRGRLLAIVLVALFVALAAATYGFNVLFTWTSSRDADSLLRSRASSELALVSTAAGRVSVRETTDDSIGDSQVWVFGRHGVVEQPRRRTPSDAAARSLTDGPERFADVAADDTRLLALPIETGRGRVGTIVVGISLAPYEQTERTALTASLAFAATLLTIVGVAVYLLLRSALRPVSRMTEQAAAWSEHDLDRRFELGEPHDELTTLAATLDGLLDRLAASLRHERRFSAELSHELRTPLARVIAEAELALRRDRERPEYVAALEVVLGNARQVARIVEALVAAAQQEAGARGVSDGVAAARNVAEACSDVAAGERVDVVLANGSAPVRVGVDGDLVERILHPLVENACRYGKSRVEIGVTRAGHRVTFVVADDGPGLAVDEAATIFDPGVRGSAGRVAGAGAGLGLALARRLARSASGEIEAEPSEAGARFVVRLPAA